MSRYATLKTALFLTTALATAGFATAKAETLADALVMAMETDPNLAAARANLQALDENVAQARAGQRPTITGGASAGTVYSRRNTPTSNQSTRNPIDLNVTATQNLYDGGQTANAVESAYATVLGGRYDLIQVEQETLLAAVSAYVEVLRLTQNVEIAQNNVRVINEERIAARNRLEVGETTVTDVAQAEARLAEAEANLAQFRGLLGQARQTYRRAIGAPPTDLAPLPPLPTLPASLDEAQAIADRNHPQIGAARRAVDAASAAVRQAMGAKLPQVDLSASASSGREGINSDSRETDLSATLNVTVPIYQGGVLNSEVRQAQALASQRRAELQDATRLIFEDVGVAWENLMSTRATIRANREQIRAAEIAFNGVQEEAKAGARTTLDVLDAEQELLEARVALVDSISEEYIASYELLSAMGLLTASHLGLDVEPYDPDPAYQGVQGLNVGWDDDDDTEWRHSWRP